MLKLGIVGCGVIGTAVAKAFDTKSVNIIRYDIVYKTVPFESILTTEFVFICTPTEVDSSELESATLDADTVRTTLDMLVVGNYAGVVLIKSTLPLDFVQELSVYATKLKITINPEFSTNANVDRDLIASQHIVLGTNRDDIRLAVVELYTHSFLRKRWFTNMPINDAIAYKLFSNVYLASKVALSNEFRQILATVSSTEWNEFAHDFVYDSRIGKSHTASPGPDGLVGYGGKCFPACVNHLSEYSFAHDVDAGIIDCTIVSNLAVKGLKNEVEIVSRRVS